MGVELGGVASPDVEPDHAAFSAPFYLFGACPALPRYDSVAATGGGLAGHRFVGADGLPYAGAAASVVHDRNDGLGDRKLDLFLPFGMTAAATAQAQGGASALTLLLSEFLALSGEHASTITGTVPPRRALSGVALVPSPFNPRTALRWTTGQRGHNRVVVYDARGRRLAVLVDELRPAGAQQGRSGGRGRGGRERGVPVRGGGRRGAGRAQGRVDQVGGWPGAGGLPLEPEAYLPPCRSAAHPSFPGAACTVLRARDRPVSTAVSRSASKPVGVLALPGLRPRGTSPAMRCARSTGAHAPGGGAPAPAGGIGSGVTHQRGPVSSPREGARVDCEHPASLRREGWRASRSLGNALWKPG